MVQLNSLLKVADNSGARLVKLIGIPGSSKRKWARIGDIIAVSAVDTVPNSDIAEHAVLKAVVVRTTKEQKRKDGSYIRFGDNAAVIIDAKKAPKGTRMFGPMARELKEKGFDKIISLAPEVL
ncbi:50S ribosomal protein L14 [Candidatus Dojkabacteria bacterium]|nr:50S ribosomal protein L14 [Candidatus Dojkabacteria bacterium]